MCIDVCVSVCMCVWVGVGVLVGVCVWGCVCLPMYFPAPTFVCIQTYLKKIDGILHPYLLHFQNYHFISLTLQVHEVILGTVLSVLLVNCQITQ